MATGGFKMSLGGLKAKPGLKAVAAKNDTKPKKALLGDDEPDDTNKAQEIAGFDAAEGGAIDINGPKEKKGPLVIPSLPNRNWREEARKKQLERAPHTQQNGDVVMDEPEKEVAYGLTVPTKPAEAQENGTTEAAEPMEVDPQDGLTDAQRLEKRALESLLNGKSTDATRIVPVITDEEALQNDLQDAPDEPDLDAYEATPIEGFGLAMLRGMGWKDSDGESRKNGAKAPKEVKRRPALLGIGAKEDAAKDVELGEFNSKARGKKGPKKDAPQGYNPVTLRNKKTGEIVTEEELKAKLVSQDLVTEEEERGRDDDGEKSERRRDRRDDRDRDRRRDEDYDSERRRDRDRKDDRREKRRDRDRDDDYDSERRREKRRDRDRRDRSRSPRDDKRRERYRSRSRDSKDRRDRRNRSRSRDDEERRRRRKEREYDDDRDDRRRRDRDEKSSRR
ncbi:hypothetical protein BU25DRAFT_408059 [Macroventuria anomochaeta]|uniref:Uncharacterized protein n=1 Tax=Macroventuria anomochaeta TaxID=301207 RepID=A0ACB6S9X1_9PLEO|nr:uncharacterized protein BU25DRAFT_408059 [Macroventuria anomochaeta]KAF2630782.1 hypothetical protein BU25DRAFT_408059 [Macroventuria anomochaeta]